jgi:hypothetical protein
VPGVDQEQSVVPLDDDGVGVGGGVEPVTGHGCVETRADLDEPEQRILCRRGLPRPEKGESQSPGGRGQAGRRGRPRAARGDAGEGSWTGTAVLVGGHGSSYAPGGPE